MWIINTGQCTTIVLAVLVSFSCNRMRNEPEVIRLQQWDLLCDSVPESISDSLNTVNAQSVYFENKGRYREALECEKEQLLLIDSLQRKPEYFRIFYSLSDRYFNLNHLDSALHYAHRAVAHIEDSTYRLNYLLYQNVAEVAAAMNNYRMANDFHRQALESYSISVDDRLNTQIQELEQRYELSKYENRTLKAETRFNFILILSAFGILFTITLFLYFRKQRVIARLKHAKLTEEKKHLEWERREAAVRLKLLNERTELQQLLLSRYDLFLQFHTDQYQQFVRMGDKIRSKQSELGDAYDKMLKTGQKLFTHLVGELFTVDEVERLFNVVVEKSTFNESDRLLLFMLSTHATNEQIAALLNTTTHNLKTRKNYLKNKIIKKAITESEFERLLKHF